MMNDSICMMAGYSKEHAPLDFKGMIRAAGLALASGGLLVVMTPFALLREDPMFWRNAGGWPIWLRELVKDTFYPLLAGELGLLVLLSAMLLCSPAMMPWRKQAWPVAALMWLWTLAVIVVVAGNNIANVLAGRPLHWHPM